jgi:hypothetical protein
MSERSLAGTHGQTGVALTLSTVRSRRRHSYHSQADSAVRFHKRTRCHHHVTLCALDAVQSLGTLSNGRVCPWESDCSLCCCSPVDVIADRSSTASGGAEDTVPADTGRRHIRGQVTGRAGSERHRRSPPAPSRFNSIESPLAIEVVAFRGGQLLEVLDLLLQLDHLELTSDGQPLELFELG